MRTFCSKINQLEKCSTGHADRNDKTASAKTHYFQCNSTFALATAFAMLELVVVIRPDGKDFTRGNLCD
jgi:hypothetical protein